MQRFLLLFIFVITVFTGQAQTNKRIVSLAASITQNLYLLGANESIVGCTRFCITEPADSIPVVAEREHGENRGSPSRYRSHRRTYSA